MIYGCLRLFIELCKSRGPLCEIPGGQTSFVGGDANNSKTKTAENAMFQSEEGVILTSIPLM